MWLAAKGRYDEAEEILRKMAKWNGVNLPNKAAIKLDRPETEHMLKVSHVKGTTYKLTIMSHINVSTYQNFQD